MRIGRIILAALAPLFSLPAVAGDVARHNVSQPGPQPGLLRTMVLLAVTTAESGAPVLTPARPVPQAVLALGVLLSTRPFQHCLWLLASAAVIDLMRRRHRRALLRC